jgi:pyruvate dehydrogenase E1 component beta subunit
MTVLAAVPAGVETEILGYGRAINQALAEEMRRDERVWMMGQDIGKMGGVFGVTRGLFDEFGPARVRDTTINETLIVGGAAGAAMTGTIPVVELQFADFGLVAGDEIFHKLAKWRYMHGGKLELPAVVRLPTGVVGGAGAEHSQSLEAMGMHVPGLKVVLPATPADAKGLLKTAIRDDGPVVVFEDKMMWQLRGPVPEGEHLVPFGVADVKRPGRDVTIVATSSMVHAALEAADALAAEGIDAEVIDPRTTVPLDRETLVASAIRTGRCLVVDEGHQRYGVTGEIAAVIAEGAFYHLDAPVQRLGAMDVPVPFSPVLEDQTIPTAAAIAASARGLVRGER